MLLGIVLAGGRSSRMGKDKALLDWCGETMLSAAVNQLTRAGCATVVISRNEPEYVNDIYVGQGPLAGVHACLQSKPCNEAIVLPVDMPMLKVTSLRQLIAFGRLNNTACYFEQSIMPFYLPEPASALSLCEQLLGQSKRSVQGMMNALSAICCLGQAEDQTDCQFMNTNTPQQLSAAQQLVLTQEYL